MTIEGDQIHYDLSGSHPAVGTFLNGSYGSTFSGVVTGSKMFFPEFPLNSGFYRALSVDLGPEGTVVNAGWPIAVTGFCSGSYGKVVNMTMELWSKVLPERAIACCPDIEYLLVGGRDTRYRERPIFMWYDWMVNGWGGRNGKDGSNVTASIFGVGEAVQPLEGQERLTPVVTSEHSILADSGGPGRFRGGCGARKGGTITGAHNTVMSYCCDRARSITWGIRGGLPSIPQGLWLTRAGGEPQYPGRDLFERDGRTGRLLCPPFGRRRRLWRPARARARARPRRRRRWLRHARARAQGLRCPSARDRRRPGRVRDRLGGDRSASGSRLVRTDLAGSPRTREV